MAANVFRASLRGWRTGVLPGCRTRWLSQTQGPPNYPSFVESVDEYRFVERLLPPTSIPKPPKHEHYPTPSGWEPPRGASPDLPYFVRRSRMHNIPVYKDITHGNRQMTVIRKVEGDIWALQKDVEDFLSSLLGKAPITQLNDSVAKDSAGLHKYSWSQFSSLKPEQEKGVWPLIL
ncbi:39S ribosomal protein L49, mitochondrial isoform X1 [Rousettus aegyptiacus]|uniref:Large ribosomal subunit protein mL49 n=1 Tax=Rousettus aegyptiacus TaxID=9407 RepID=A0A7J8H2F4_ROUAE|nr:39S ribosomal protein L49, mitochondrial isoform X1 [Rousettus aegyptiacus]KAF6466436.1 mitochondrial ribosomal protein L49 [Rousettus aegyptiacus]